MKQYFLMSVISLWFSIDAFSADSQVRLQGRNISGYKGEVEISNQGVGSDCRCPKKFFVKLDKNGNFDTTITVSKPEYWNIDMCDAYLVPGGNLEITYNASQKEYTFAGTTAKECAFLTKNPVNIYVDLSFLDGGKNVRKIFDETKRIVDSLSSIRLRLLDSRKDLDPTFVELEKAFTKAHVANSYLNYFLFSKSGVRYGMGDETKAPEWKEFVESIRRSVTPLCQELLKDNYLVNSDIRFVVERCKKDGLVAIPKGSEWDQLYSVQEMLEKLEDSASPKTLGNARALLSKLTNTDLSEILKSEINRVDVLANGKPAFDIELEDIDGKTLNLSDFKGNVIYVDMWATWCGYCIKEFPSFLKLKEKFPNVVFVSISTDESKTLWKKYLAAKPKTDVIQCLSVNRVKLGTNWNIHGIPRFLLIDKNFKIVDAFAPRPSNTKEIEPLLNKLH
jgi:Peroxiredoxin